MTAGTVLQPDFAAQREDWVGFTIEADRWLWGTGGACNDERHYRD